MRKHLICTVASLLLLSNVFSQEVVIGKDDFGEADLPFTSGAYSYSQYIYKQQWIHAAGSIDKLSYYYEASAIEEIDIDVYMGHTSMKANVIKGWLPEEDLTLVFSGTLSLAGTLGWVDIILDTPFEYNNVDNLAIVLDKNSITSYENHFLLSEIDDDLSSIFVYDQNYNIDPSSSIPWSFGSSRLPNIRLSGTLAISPYLYIYGKTQMDITTDPDSSATINVETNLDAFSVSSVSSWLATEVDVINKMITVSVVAPNNTLDIEKRTASVVLSGTGVSNDTLWLHQYRFEPLEIEQFVSNMVDYDNDGDLDMVGDLMIGENNGSNVFTDIGLLDYTGEIVSGRTFWADYNKDGYSDFILIGSSGIRNYHETSIYRNDTTGFTKINADITSFYPTNDAARWSKVSWCDYDNDGDLDFIIAGQDTSRFMQTTIYKNLGDDTFIESGIDIHPCASADMDWGDFNNDGWMDLMLTGLDNSGNANTILYKNEGNDVFEPVKNNFPQLRDGNPDWGDYDNDGDLDVLFCGGSFNKDGITVYRNDEDGTFELIEVLVDVGYSESKSRWIDTDNDGDLDIISYGLKHNNGGAEILRYKNEGNDVFSIEYLNYFPEILTSANEPDVVVFDFDNDGDLDFKVQDLHGNMRSVHRNNTNSINEAPSIPTALSSSLKGDGVHLSWAPSSDTETPSNSIKYSVRVGTEIDSDNILSPPSDFNTGILKTHENGQLVSNTFKVISDLPNGTYYWSVQAVDNMFASSQFSVIDSFEVKDAFTVLDHSIPALSYGSCNWGDYDNDGDFDVIIKGGIGSFGDYATKLLKNNGDSTFSEVDAGFVGLFSGSSVWGDYDNDNDLDLLVTGKTEEPSGWELGKIYRNDGNDVFTDIMVDVGEVHQFSCASWGDYDNDGKLDFVINGVFFHNNGDDSFSRAELNIKITDFAALSFADIDNDSDLDFIIKGQWINTLLYINQEGDFFESDNNLMRLSYGSVDWGDFDNDGDLDLVMVGKDTIQNNYGIIYTNQGGGEFIENRDIIKGTSEGQAFWGDYNNDGFLDIISTGLVGNFNFEVYENLNGKSFNLIYGSPTSFAENSYLEWVDYNNDGNLDIFKPTEILSNNLEVNENTIPVPKNLNISIDGFDVIYQWDDFEDEKYTCNLRVGTTPGGTDINSPMADIETGRRKIQRLGNVQKNNAWIIKNLAAGQTYYWSVQAIDNSYRGGAWAEEQSFTMLNIYSDFSADTVCLGLETAFTDLSISPAEEITSWKWDFGDGDTSMSRHPSHIFGAADTFMVKLVINSAQFSDSTTKKVIVNPKPFVDFTTEDVCDGASTSFHNTTDLNSLVVNSWLWNFGDESSSSEQDPASHGYLNPGAYPVQLKATATNGCSDSISRIASVGAIPIASIASSGNTVLCDGDSITLSNAYTKDYIYQWKLDEIDLSDTDSSKYIVKSSGSFNVEVTNPVGNCMTTSEPMPVVVNPVPTVSNLDVSGNTTFCNGDSVILFIPEIDEVNYHWYKNGNPIGENNHQLIVKESGNYYLLLSNSFGCSSNTSSTVTVNVLPTPGIGSLNVSGSTTFCDGDTLTIGVDNDPDLSYNWYLNGLVIDGGNQSILAATNEGAYFLKVSNEHSCYVNSQTINATILPSPPALTISAESGSNKKGVLYTDQLCVGDSIDLTLLDDETLTYKWMKDGIFTGIEGDAFSPTTSGTYTAEISNTHGCVCETDNDISITFNEQPQKPLLSFSEDQVLCGGAGISMSINNPQNDVSYFWNVDGRTIAQNETSLLLEQSGSYQIMASNTFDCYNYSSETMITVVDIQEKPEIYLAEGSNNPCPDDKVILSIQNPIPELTYQWKKNTILLSSSIGNELAVEDNGWYSVRVLGLGCSVKSDSTNIQFRPGLEKPDITAEGPNIWYLACSNDTASIYKWYHEGLLIEDSDKYIHVANQQLGLYHVEISDNGDCFTSSDIISLPDNVIISSIQTDPWENLKIYPNPTPGLFTLEMDNPIMGELIIDIFGENGKQIINIKFLKEMNHFQTQIDLSGQPAAVYIIGLMLEEYRASRSLVVE